MSIEDSVPLRKALRAGKGLICTDINATTKPDLIGIGTDWFFGRYLGVNIFLNNSDPEAKKQNDSIGANSLGKEDLLMLTNVHPTNTQLTGTYDNVCVVVEGSVVGFNISSWAAAGFQYYIAPDQGDEISTDLCVCTGQTPNQYVQAQLLRYQSPHDNPLTIQIIGADQAPIGTSTVKFQKVTFKSRRISKYTQDGNTYQSDQKQPAAKAILAMTAQDGDDNTARSLANANDGVVVVPGNSIKPGGPTEGPPSQQEIGTVFDVETDDWTEALGTIVVFFFVFKSLDDAKRVIGGYNAPDPNLWK
jgi:hypothetical protein